VQQWRANKNDAAAIPNDAMEATLIGFRMWVAAVERAGTTDATAVRAAMADMTFDAPSGFCVRMDGETQHLHKPAFVGRFNGAGAILPVWSSAGLVPPEPWSPWLKRDETKELPEGSPYIHPRAIESLAELPRTEAGKVQGGALRARG
jgi:urea transport system substrate-binding protein